MAYYVIPKTLHNNCYTSQTSSQFAARMKIIIQLQYSLTDSRVFHDVKNITQSSLHPTQPNPWMDPTHDQPLGLLLWDYLQAGCPSCHLANSVKTLTGRGFNNNNNNNNGFYYIALFTAASCICIAWSDTGASSSSSRLAMVSLNRLTTQIKI